MSKAVDSAVTVGPALGDLHNAFYANGTITWLEALFVDERERGEGFGERRLSEFENGAFRNGAKLNALATRRAQDFYQVYGYEISATYLKKHF